MKAPLPPCSSIGSSCPVLGVHTSRALSINLHIYVSTGIFRTERWFLYVSSNQQSKPLSTAVYTFLSGNRVPSQGVQVTCSPFFLRPGSHSRSTLVAACVRLWLLLDLESSQAGDKLLL